MIETNTLPLENSCQLQAKINDFDNPVLARGAVVKRGTHLLRKSSFTSIVVTNSG